MPTFGIPWRIFTPPIKMGGHKQRGGAVKSLLGSGYVDDITRPEQMMEKVAFYLMMSHGAANIEALTTVPENTFLIYAGPSGFTTYMIEKNNTNVEGLMNIKKLLSPDGYDLPNASDRKERYRDGLFRNFFKGDYDTFKMYKGMEIFCPGDLVQDTVCSFQNKTNDYFWNKGLYMFPMPNDEAERFGIRRDNLYTVHTMYMLFSNKDTNEAYKNTFEKAQPRAEVQDKLEILTAEKDPARFQEIWKTVADEMGVKENLEALAGKLFEDPHVIEDFFMNMSYNHPDNLLITKGLNALPTNQIYLSHILHTLEPPEGKKYKFIVFTGCRNPITKMGMNRPLTNYGPLPKTVNTTRRTARRFSIAAKKQEDEVCAFGPSPPLNLGKLRDLFSQFELHKETRDKIIETIPFEMKGGRLTPDPLWDLLNPLLLFTIDDSGKLQYKDTIRINTFANILNLIVTPSRFLTVYEADDTILSYAKEVLKVYREIFGYFMMGLRFNNPNESANAVAIGQLLLKSINRGNLRIFPTEEGKLAEEERRFLGERLNKYKQREEIILYDKFRERVQNLLGNLLSINTILLGPKIRKAESDLMAAKGIARDTKSNIHQKKKYLAKNLKDLKTTVSGIFESLEFLPRENVDSYEAMFSKLPKDHEGAKKLSNIRQLINDMDTAKIRYQEIIREYEIIVGAIALDVQKEVIAAGRIQAVWRRYKTRRNRGHPAVSGPAGGRVAEP